MEVQPRLSQFDLTNIIVRAIVGADIYIGGAPCRPPDPRPHGLSAVLVAASPGIVVIPANPDRPGEQVP